jgi:hypothetical protein
MIALIGLQLHETIPDYGEYLASLSNDDVLAPAPPPNAEALRRQLESVVDQALASMPAEMRAQMGDPDNPTIANLHVPMRPNEPEPAGEPAPLPRGRDRMPQAEFEEFQRSRDIILGLTAKMAPQAQRLMIELLTEQADDAVRP